MGRVRGEKSGGGIVFVAFVLFVLVIAWIVAPYFLPMYRWLDLDWQAAADVHSKVSLADVQQNRKFIVRYNPRDSVANDPIPWQIVLENESSLPKSWPDHEGEYDICIRLNIYSDRDGKVLPKLFTVGSTVQDRYFNVEGWALPPKSLGSTNPRPVLLLDRWSMSKMTIGEAKGVEGRATEFADDDDWY